MEWYRRRRSRGKKGRKGREGTEGKEGPSDDAKKREKEKGHEEREDTSQSSRQNTSTDNTQQTRHTRLTPTRPSEKRKKSGAAAGQPEQGPDQREQHPPLSFIIVTIITFFFSRRYRTFLHGFLTGLYTSDRHLTAPRNDIHKTRIDSVTRQRKSNKRRYNERERDDDKERAAITRHDPTLFRISGGRATSQPSQPSPPSSTPTSSPACRQPGQGDY